MAPKKPAARKPRKAAPKTKKPQAAAKPLADEAKGGRPPHVPTAKSRKLVEQMSGTGAPTPDIGKMLGIDAKTVRKYYREELDSGFIKANHAVSGSLYRQATKGNVAAAIWWEKTRQGRSERIAFSGPDGEAISVEVTGEITAKQAAKAYEDTVRGR